MTDNPSQWCSQSYELLRYLYQDLNIFNWSLISNELSQRLNIQASSDQCRNKYILKIFRYLEIFGPVERGDWIHEEEKELYRLHNENGNKWAVIAQNILGRKSLRTINKIAKLHLKKDAKEISDVVIYKLTEATDESLKQNSDLPQEIIAMCYDLKNRLLQYEMDQRDIKQNLNYQFEKQLLHALSEFNKIYKKKSKKQKTLVLGTENLKKKKDTKQGNSKFFVDNQGFESQDQSAQKQVQQKTKKQKMKATKNNQLVVAAFSSFDQISSIIVPGIARSQSQYSSSLPKKTLNLVIQAPSKEKNNHKKSIDLQSSSRLQQKFMPSDNMIPFVTTSPKSKPKQKNPIEDLLKAEGILENAFSNQYDRLYKGPSSVRSFSVCSSEHPDMFGDDIIFHGDLKQLSQMDHDSQIFRIQQTDDKKDWN